MFKKMTIAAAILSVLPAMPALADERGLTVQQDQMATVTPQPAQTETITIGALLDRPNATYAIGDAVNLTVNVDREAYVTVFNVSPDGTTTVLFPNQFNQDNRVAANTAITVPGPGAKIQVGGPAGQELIKIIASEQPLPLPNLADFQSAGGYESVGAGGAERVARQLNVISETPESSSEKPGLGVWGEKSLILTTVAAGTITATPATPAADTTPFSIVLGTDQPSYKVGQKIAFTLQATKNCHLTLLNFGSSGKSTVLFPTAEGQNNLIQANVPVRVPGVGSTGALVAQGPIGNETVLAVCSTDDRKVVASASQLGSVNATAMSGGVLSPRDIGTIMPPTQTPGQVAQSSISFAVTQ
ncbi:MAG: DUF4384 domain-containing protein [Pseudomonadota bacterium]